MKKYTLTRILLLSFFCFGLPLTSGVWIPLTNATLDAAGALRFSDPASTNLPARFYRIVWP